MRPGNVFRGMDHLSSISRKRSPLHKAVRFVTGIIAVAFIGWILYCVPYDILREERFRLLGEKRTTGVVLAVHTGDATSSKARFMVDYKFVDPDGYARTAVAPLPEDIWKMYRPGNRVEVFYPSSKPEMSRIPHEIEPAFQVWLRSMLD